MIAIGYANSLNGEFHLDDLTFKEDATLHLTDLKLDSLASVVWHRRPVASSTFALNYYWGGHEVFGYHMVNVAIHLAAALAWYAFLVIALGLPRAQPLFQNREAAAALAATLLWAIHPVQTQAVSYVVQRMTTLASLFYVLALVAYLKGRLSAGMRRWVWWAIALASAALALGSKENAATLPVAVLLIEVCLMSGLRGLRWRTVMAWTVGLAVPVLIVAIFAAQHEAGGSFLTQLTAHRSTTQWFSVGERLLTEGRVIIHYIGLLMFPHPSRLTFDYAFPISHSWLDPPTTVLAWAAIAAALTWALWSVRRTPVASFCVLWFFLNLAVESTVIRLDLVFEHRLYLPSMGAALGAVALGMTIGRRLGAWGRSLAPIACAVLLILWTSWTIERNRVWATDFSLWADTAAKAPANPRALTLLGIAYTDHGEADKALEAFQAAARANPDFHDAHANLGSALIGRGDLTGALEAFTRARALDPNNAEDAYHLGLIYYKLGRMEEAQREYEASLQLDPEDAETHNNLGAVHQAAGRWEAAKAEYESALQRNPELAAAHYGLGQVYHHLGREGEAIQSFQETIRGNPTHLDAHLALAGIYLGRDDKPAALVWFQAALQLAPTSPQGHFQVARLLDQLGRRSEALAAYRQFVALAASDQAQTRSWAQERIRALEARQG
ncbi:MAG TPA: tetratricopeptide repeat protein [Nitrospiria bacterium]|nr:tetratricopeptide repeat protein [Nitrospiria bacterium]